MSPTTDLLNAQLLFAWDDSLIFPVAGNCLVTTALVTKVCSVLFGTIWQL